MVPSPTTGQRAVMAPARDEKRPAIMTIISAAAMHVPPPPSFSQTNIQDITSHTRKRHAPVEYKMLAGRMVHHRASKHRVASAWLDWRKLMLHVVTISRGHHSDMLANNRYHQRNDEEGHEENDRGRYHVVAPRRVERRIGD